MAAIRVHTNVSYRGLPIITVIGHGNAALIAIAGYATPRERALGAITAEPGLSGQRYPVIGHAGSVATVNEAAKDHRAPA